MYDFLILFLVKNNQKELQNLLQQILFYLLSYWSFFNVFFFKDAMVKKSKKKLSQYAVKAKLIPMNGQVC